MTTRLLVAGLMLAGSALIGGAAAAQSQSPGKPAARAQVHAAAAKPTEARRLTADQAYKANCTRCHAELPKLRPKGMATVLMHMRVRGNIPDEDARAILEYLTR